MTMATAGQPAVRFTGRVVQYLTEVRAEVRKVTWPAWEELRKSTGVIIVFLILMGLLIGFMDWAFAMLLVNLLGRVLG